MAAVLALDVFLNFGLSTSFEKTLFRLCILCLFVVGGGCWGGGRDRVVDVGWLSFRTLWQGLGWVGVGWGQKWQFKIYIYIRKATMTNHFSADGTLSFCFLVGAGQHQEVER